MKQPINMARIDITKTIHSLNGLAEQLKSDQHEKSLNVLATQLSDGIYEVCK